MSSPSTRASSASVTHSKRFEMDATKITRVKGYYKGAGYTYYPVVIVGAGETGIACAYKLKKAGYDQFRVFDRQAGVGGTWWINRYPGVACDVPAVFYSFSFAPNPKWTSFYPPGPEIYAYLEDVCNKNGLIDKIQLNTDITECRWLESEQVWEITVLNLRPGMGDLSARDRQKRIQEDGLESVISSSETVRAKVLLSGVGGLVEPKAWPDNIPGIEKFKGAVFHSARWDYGVDLKDKNVVVVGTGCSAAQFVPHLSKKYGAKSVTQLMRSPPWIEGKHVPPLGEETWAKIAPYLNGYVPGFMKMVRTIAFFRAESDFRMFGGSAYAESVRKSREKSQLARMRRMVPKKYHEMLTPDYGIGCKRRVFDSNWYNSLNDSKVELTTQPLRSVQEDSVTIGPGQTYPKQLDNPPARDIPADVIVLANGFETAKWLHPLRVKGKGGKDLVEAMDERGGPQAYLGTAMDGFPNFLIIFGPNTATGHSSVIYASECMANYALNFVRPILDGDTKTFEVKRSAEIAWTQGVQDTLKKSVWQSGGCFSWYYDENKWNSTMCPYSQIWMWWRWLLPRWNDWNIQYTRKGLAKLYFGRIIKAAMFMVALNHAYRVMKGKAKMKVTIAMHEMQRE